MSSTITATPQRSRVWAQDVVVSADAMLTKMNTILAGRAPSAEDQEIQKGVETLLAAAKDAAHRQDHIPTAISNWWRGALINAAYQNLHAAEAAIVPLYGPDEIRAQIPQAVARVQSGLYRDDIRRAAASTLLKELTSDTPASDENKATLRKAIEIGYAASDQQHSRVRSFRNVILAAAIIIAAFVLLFVLFVRTNPSAVPFCFRPSAKEDLYCPAGAGVPSSADVVIVALLGLLGGALAAAVSIRNARGTSTPYGLPASLALLKVPTGALTALGSVLLIGGDFVPGLSSLDSQGQILAYALVFGYAQQLLTGMIDKQAKEVLESIPSKDPQTGRPSAHQDTVLV